MQNQPFQYKAKDALNIHVYKWLPNEKMPIKGIFFIVHGSVEHAKRYEHFAEFLTKNGYAVYAPDLRGHGITGKESKELSYFPKNGWNLLVDDLAKLHKIVLEDFSSLPIFLLGHSMGSFIVRDYIANYSGDFNGVILSGGTIGQPILTKIMQSLAKLLGSFYGAKAETPFIHDQIYGKLNRELKDYKTDADFISYDEKEVQKYLDDELCGITITYNYAIEFAKGAILTALPKTFQDTPNDLPILMISGKDDPVGGKQGEDVVALHKAYLKNGAQKVELKLYENARHELLNELNKEVVMDDILKWMKENQ